MIDWNGKILSFDSSEQKKTKFSILPLTKSRICQAWLAAHTLYLAIQQPAVKIKQKQNQYMYYYKNCYTQIISTFSTGK